MNIAIVCIWLSERINKSIPEDEIQTGAFAEALRRAINELQVQIPDNDSFQALSDLDKELLPLLDKPCTEIGVDKCIALFERYNRIYKIARR